MALLQEPIKDPIEIKNYINGEWVAASTGKTFSVVNPATRQPLASAPLSAAADTEAAVAAAREAFDGWRRTSPVVRARYVLRLRELMEENFEDLSRIQTQEHGKTIDESRGETRRGIEMTEVAGGIPSLMMGYNLEDIASGIDEYAIYQPLGVFGHIAPYNFPFMVPLWYVPFALATGNSFVVKASPRVPISQTKVAELVEEAGIPAGVYNLVHGEAEPGEALLTHPDVKGVTFVGSTTVGKYIYRKCGEQGKRSIVQASAKNFLVVMPDANVEKTVAALLTSFFGNTGQRCLAGGNLVIVGRDDGFYREVLEKFRAASARIKIGYGLDEAVQMGPINSVNDKKRVLGYIDKGLEEGAELVLDGRQPEISGDLPDDCFLGPSIFAGVTPDMVIAQEEIFGPVACVIRAETLDEAIAMTNASRYGNAASLFTGSGGAAREFQYRVNCGNIGINIGIAAPMAFFPFSGMKDSFFGVLHGQGKDAVRFFTEAKISIQRWF